jgi:hypothetical protein
VEGCARSPSRSRGGAHPRPLLRDLPNEGAEIPIRLHTVAYPLAEANGALQDLKPDRIDGTAVLLVATT